MISSRGGEIRRAPRVDKGWLWRGGVAMDYRFCYVGADYEVLRRHEFQAETDTVAVEVAWHLFKLTGLPEFGFELWQDTRRIVIHNC